MRAPDTGMSKRERPKEALLCQREVVFPLLNFNLPLTFANSSLIFCLVCLGDYAVLPQRMEGLGEHGEHRIGNERHFRRLRVEEEVYQKYYNLCFSYIYFKISDFFFPFFQEAKIEQDGCGEQHLCPSRTTQGNSDSTTPDECREKEEIQIYL